MADDATTPVHTRDAATSKSGATLAAVSETPDATSYLIDAGAQEFLDLLALIESFRVVPVKSQYVVTADKLADEYLRVTHKVPTVRVLKACHLVASQCAPSQASKALELALNRMYGAVAQRVKTDSTVTLEIEYTKRPMLHAVVVDEDDASDAVPS